MEVNNEVIEEINGKLSWIIQHERKHLLNENDSLLHLIDDDILNFLVNHWYTCREPQLFFNENGVEIDEYLNIEEYRF
jgi:hypothetical protein